MRAGTDENLLGSSMAHLIRCLVFLLYGGISVVEKIRMALVKEFNLEELYFSAPTFITRLIGNDSWTPVEVHDEYW